MPALFRTALTGLEGGRNSTSVPQATAAGYSELQDFAAQLLGALDQFTRDLHERREVPTTHGDAQSMPSDMARRSGVLDVLNDQTLTDGQKYQIIADSGVTAQEVERYAGWEPGTAAARMREIKGVSSARQVLEGVKAGRWSAERAATLLQGVGGSASERLQFGREASEYFVSRLIGPEEADQAGWHGQLSTAGIWDALLLGNITAEDAIQSSQARVSEIAMNLPGFGASESGSGVLVDFGNAELLAHVDIDAARSIGAKVWMDTHDGVPPQLGPDQMQEFMANYNAPVPEELQFLLDLPAAPGVSRGLGYRDSAETRLAETLRDLASGAGRLIDIS
jgi:hypothetical protein